MCGSDGVTYRNRCGLKLASCGKGKNITVAKLEPCDGDYYDTSGRLLFHYTILVQFLNNKLVLHLLIVVELTISI